MQSFSEIEFALNKISGFSFNDGPFVGTEDKLLKIMLGRRNADQLKKDLADFLINTHEKFSHKLKIMRPVYTIQDYSQKSGLTPKQVRYLILKGRIKAVASSEGRRKTWLIPITGVMIK